ncbi:MAG: hypothetical protein WD851_23845 [Pirellulales bacterium]
MLQLKCDKCGRELHEPGALVFSPPTGESWIVEKYHVCAECWPTVLAMLQQTIERPSPT